jgi:hypothetical protein
MLPSEHLEQRATADRSDDRPRLLLHICCAPCSTHVIEVLRPQFRVSGFFYNPNIFPPRERTRRLEEARRLCRRLNVPFFEGPPDDRMWNRRMRGRQQDREGGPSCSVCFWIRLWRTAQEARRRDREYFATTLTISPHKNAAAVHRMGRKAARRSGVRFYARDFKKEDGFRRSCRLSERYHLYRQDYCGCLYSLRERRGLRTAGNGTPSAPRGPKPVHRDRER